jgi:hypothetical protein
MPITASINRHPETENQFETAAPHPEEMKATFDLTIGLRKASKKPGGKKWAKIGRFEDLIVSYPPACQRVIRWRRLLRIPPPQ